MVNGESDEDEERGESALARSHVRLLRRPGQEREGKERALEVFAITGWQQALLRKA